MISKISILFFTIISLADAPINHIPASMVPATAPIMATTTAIVAVEQLTEKEKPALAFTGVAPISASADCNNADCVYPVGYSYWKNMNNHVGQPEISIFIGLKHEYGGPTLYKFNKLNGEVRKVGPLFDASSPFSYSTTEGWYWSAKSPQEIYVSNAGTKLFRYNVDTKQFETVLDIANRFESSRYVWQTHSSDDDRVHAGTIRDSANYQSLGCFAYQEDRDTFSYYPAKKNLDECNLDGSSRWLVMLDGEDNRIIDLDTGTEQVLLDKEGALGHLDMGYGYMVGSDNYNLEPNATVLIKFPLTNLNHPAGITVHVNRDWDTAEVNHISHQNRRPGPPENQFACGSNADTVGNNKIVCFKLDGSLARVEVAQVGTDLAAYGGVDSYSKFPKGNLDITGGYFFWTSNSGGSRLDAYIVKVLDFRQ